jgi:hypothetical protein
MKIIVEDVNSGVSKAYVTVVGEGGSQLSTTSLIRESDSIMSIPVAFPKDGEFKLLVCAIDNVGNATGSGASCDVPLTVHVDTTPPKMNAMTAHMVDWSRNASIPFPTIPIFGSQAPTLNIAFDPKAAQIACNPNPECAFLPVIPVATWQRSNGQVKAVDTAGNETTIRYATVRLPDFSIHNTKKRFEQWRTAGMSLVAPLRAAFAVEPELKLLVRSAKLEVMQALTTLEDEKSSDQSSTAAAKTIFDNVQNTNLLVDWLNLMNGSIYPGDRVLPKELDRCVRSMGVPVDNLTELQWLHYKAQCSATVSGERYAGK